MGDPNCLYKVGDMYLKGQFVKKDKEMALDLYYKALERETNGGNDPNNDVFVDIALRIRETIIQSNWNSEDMKNAFQVLSVALFHLYDMIDPYNNDKVKRVKKCLSKVENCIERFGVKDRSSEMDC